MTKSQYESDSVDDTWIRALFCAPGTYVHSDFLELSAMHRHRLPCYRRQDEVVVARAEQERAQFTRTPRVSLSLFHGDNWVLSSPSPPLPESEVGGHGARSKAT